MASSESAPKRWMITAVVLLLAGLATAVASLFYGANEVLKNWETLWSTATAPSHPSQVLSCTAPCLVNSTSIATGRRSEPSRTRSHQGPTRFRSFVGTPMLQTPRNSRAQREESAIKQLQRERSLVAISKRVIVRAVEGRR